MSLLMTDDERHAKWQDEADEYKRNSAILSPLITKYVNVDGMLNELNQMLHAKAVPPEEATGLKWHLAKAFEDTLMESVKFLGGDPADVATPPICRSCQSNCK